MTFKQLLTRYLKEAGLYHYLSEISYSDLKEYFNYKNTFFLEWVNFVFKLKGVNWFYKGSNEYLFFKDWADNDFHVKKGDIVTVKTPDEKYFFKFKVFEIWKSTYSIETESGGRILFNRIVAVNDKKVDFENGWYFKRDINNVRKLNKPY